MSQFSYCSLVENGQNYTLMKFLKFTRPRHNVIETWRPHPPQPPSLQPPPPNFWFRESQGTDLEKNWWGAATIKIYYFQSPRFQISGSEKAPISQNSTGPWENVLVPHPSNTAPRRPKSAIPVNFSAYLIIISVTREIHKTEIKNFLKKLATLRHNQVPHCPSWIPPPGNFNPAGKSQVWNYVCGDQRS